MLMTLYLVTFVIALVGEWKRQLGNYMIDNNTLKIEKMIAKGERKYIGILR